MARFTRRLSNLCPIVTRTPHSVRVTFLEEAGQLCPQDDREVTVPRLGSPTRAQSVIPVHAPTVRTAVHGRPGIQPSPLSPLSPLLSDSGLPALGKSSGRPGGFLGCLGGFPGCPGGSLGGRVYPGQGGVPRAGWCTQGRVGGCIQGRVGGCIQDRYSREEYTTLGRVASSRYPGIPPPATLGFLLLQPVNNPLLAPLTSRK